MLSWSYSMQSLYSPGESKGKQDKPHEISYFNCSVCEVFTLLGPYVAYVASCLSTFGTNRLSQNTDEQLPTYTA